MQDTLRIWAELGAKDPEQLKQLLVKRSMAPLTALAAQSVLDFVACGGELKTASRTLGQQMTDDSVSGSSKTPQCVWCLGYRAADSSQQPCCAAYLRLTLQG